jgi:hypothetical protein
VWAIFSRLSAGLSADRVKVRLVLGTLAVLASVYALQVASPLRLTTDSVVYLTMAHSIANGHGVSAHTQFPAGLPAAYALLALAGAGRSWAIVTLNVALLALAVASTILLYRRALGIGRVASLFLGCGALCSYVLVKFGALALSDVPFLGVSSAALALLTVAAQGRSRRRFAVLGLGVVLVALATAVRSAGVALAPAALLAAEETARAGAPLRMWLRTRAAAMTVGACAAATALFAYLLSSSLYFQNASVGYAGTTVGSLLAGHLRNWGELGVNVPETKLPQALHPLLVPAGVVVVAVLIAGLWRLRGRPEPVHVFVLAYLALIFLWPYTDARFWIPLVPLAVGYAYVALAPVFRNRAAAMVLCVYVTAFLVIGVAALAYSTRLSFSGRRFANLYGTSAGLTLQPTYRVAFGEAQPGDASHVDRKALAVLREWEPLARRP